MRRAITTVLIAAFSLVSSSSALQVTPGSSCSSVCLDSETGNALDPAASTTNASDIACYDVDYYSTTVGVKFKNCLECLQTSKNASESESDVSWFLCAIETGLNLQGDSGEFAYCSVDDSVLYGTGIDDCVSCLQSNPDSYVANFLIAIQAGCQQQPASGALLDLAGELFSGYPINISTTRTVSNSSLVVGQSQQKEVLSTGAIIGIIIGAAGLLIIAMMLFYLYWQKQQKYDREDAAMTADPSVFYGKGPGSHMSSLTSGNSNSNSNGNGFAPAYIADHKTPPPSYAPPGSQGLELGYVNNAEYYDRMEGKSRGWPRPAPGGVVHSTEVNSASRVDVSALPTHPAYIARGHAHARLGSRASRNSVASVRSEPRYNKPDDFTVQMYMSSLEDARDPPRPAPAPAPQSQPQPAPQDPRPDGISRAVGISRETSLRNIRVELAGLSEASSSSSSSSSAPRRQPSVSDPTGPRQGGRATPTPQAGRTTPFPGQGGRSTPAPLQQPPGGRSTPAPSVLSRDSSLDMGGGRRASSLILPSVPRIKIPVKKPPKLSFTSASPVEDISGPLAFPDSRFARRTDDRIVEQTALDRGEPVEVPIGSGKSYLYG
ncbi:hypothetical protein VSDG_01620 [Cytospora chrysosperma]|uniref:Uncharacterized protein n=1 Tax=Cytospora chrysosperma TaxID=252740 RepID=A0A423WGY5_CYTCH|nr:hypothetical protein VSDG_01620 [Valsa sordida]